MRYTKVYAPITGRIGRSSVTEGALVSNGQAEAMAVIQQLDPIVDVTQSSVELLNCAANWKAVACKGRRQRRQGQADPEDGSQYKLDGKLEFSEVSVDQTTGSVTLRAVFPNPDHTLLPGMFVHAQLQAGVNSRGHPGAATGRDPRPQGSPTALVVGPDNKVELRQLKPAVPSARLADRRRPEAGDRLITEGLQYVAQASRSKPAKRPTFARTRPPLRQLTRRRQRE
jgi:membrane fusion protein (multidrug efflux system)